MKRKLIVFAKSPVSGRVKTRLARSIGSTAAKLIYEAMVEDTSTMVGEIPDCEVTWWIDGEEEVLRRLAGEGATFQQQPEGDLGQRLKVAFAHGFFSTPCTVAAICTDCPRLSSDELTRLFETLEGSVNSTSADAAFIPSSDGGYSAIGLASSYLGVFDLIRWSDPNTLADSLAQLDSAGLKTTLLDESDDLDDWSDLERLVAGDAPLLLRPRLNEALERLGLARDSAPAVPDDLGRAIPLSPLPRRMISLIPSVTECLFDLGAGDRVMGRTDYCISPDAVRRLESVGGPKSLDVEKIISLKPDLIWADAEENSREEVEQLIEAGLRVFVALPRTIGDVAAFISRTSKLCGAREKGDQALAELDRLGPPPTLGRTRAVCLIWKDPFMSASKNTLLSSLMELSGLSNIIDSADVNYPEISPGELAALEPEVVLLPSEPYLFTAQEAEEIGNLLPQAEIIHIPGEWVTWYGLRTPERVKELRRILVEKL